MSVPQLPAEHIRDAIATGDWSLANELLSLHQSELAKALQTADRSDAARESWAALQLAHQSFLAELRIARDQAADALARVAEDQRRARAWLRELA